MHCSLVSGWISCISYKPYNQAAEIIIKEKKKTMLRIFQNHYTCYQWKKRVDYTMSPLVFFFCCHFPLVSSTKEAMECSSSLVPHSFSSSVVSVGHVLPLSCSVSGQLINTCSGVDYSMSPLVCKCRVINITILLFETIILLEFVFHSLIQLKII